MAPMRLPSRATTGFLAVGAGTAYYGYSQYQTASFKSRLDAIHGACGNAKYSAWSAAEPPLPEKILGGKPTFAGSGFVTLALESSRMVNHNVKELRFKLPEGDTVSGLGPVSSLLTRHTPAGSWIPVFRPYTPISTADEEGGHLTLLVKRYPNGKASGHMHSIQPGDQISAKPLQELAYTPNQYGQINLIAGGAGITPFVQLIRTIFANPADNTRVSLVYANSTDSDVLCKDEFDDLARRFPDRFRARYVVSGPANTIADAPSAGDAAIERGYITKSVLAQAVQASQGDGVKSSSKTLVCGPPPMMEAVCGAKGGFGWTQGSIGGILKELGYTKDQVQKF